MCLFSHLVHSTYLQLQSIDVIMEVLHVIEDEDAAASASAAAAEAEQTKSTLGSRIPLQSLYCHLIIYLFLPMSRKYVSLASGLAVSTICLILFIAIEVHIVSSKNCRRAFFFTLEGKSQVCSKF